jgi:hypothetical protein
MRRFFTMWGPATLKDFTWWSGLTVTDAKKGMKELESSFEHEEIGGQSCWFPDTVPHKQPAAPTAYLLPAYDEYFIGYKDRSAIGARIGGVSPEALARALYANIVFVNGEVVGGWRRVETRDAVQVQLDLVVPITKKEERALAAAAKGFAKFLGKGLELTDVNFPGRREPYLFR